MGGPYALQVHPNPNTSAGSVGFAALRGVLTKKGFRSVELPDLLVI